MQSARNKKERGGYVIIFVAITMAIIMGTLGFAIDAAVLYTIRAKLSAACDAASLAAARNLNVGLTMAEQETAARARATSFYEANFPPNYLGSTRNPASVSIPVSVSSSVLTVTTAGSADAPTFFMRYFGTGAINLRASGTASRRDVNVMLVLDRSSSMKTNDPDPKVMPKSAIWFLEQFVEGRDQVGLIVFGTDIAEIKPTSDDFKRDLKAEINKIKYDNSTNIVMAYWQAYQDLVDLNEPSALNVILLFTDGNPNGMYAKFKTTGGSGCNGGEVLGLLTRGGPKGAKPGTAITGMFKVRAAGVSSMGASLIDNADDCKFKTDKVKKAEAVPQDINGIPAQDYFGNKTQGYPGQYASFDSDDLVGGKLKHGYAPAQLKYNKNLLDHAAMRIRDRVSNPNIGVVTFAIGLGNPAETEINEQPDDVLLRRVANDPRGASDPNSVYRRDPDLPDGMYFRADDMNQLTEAFQKIASEVLRLSR